MSFRRYSVRIPWTSTLTNPLLPRIAWFATCISLPFRENQPYLLHVLCAWYHAGRRGIKPTYRRSICGNL